MKQEYLLEGLGCANCAARMESRIGLLPQVARASVYFATSTLVIEAGTSADFDAILPVATDIIRQIEPHVIVREKQSHLDVAAVMTTACPDGSCTAAIVTDWPAAAITLPGVLDTAGYALSDSDAVAAQPSPDIAQPSWRGRLASISTDNKILAIGAGLFLAALVLPLPTLVGRVLFIAAWLLAGSKVLLRAGRNIARGEVFDENFLMALATLGAVAIGEYPEAVAVMLFYRAGVLLESRAVSQSRQSVQALLGIRPDYANLRTAAGLARVSPAQVAPGSLIVIRPGERVPLDGIVQEGRSSLDTSAITGESAACDVAPGDAILSGTVNLDGLLTVATTRSYGESTVARILDLVENAASHKARTEAFITRFARWYTPAVVATAAALAFLVPLLVPGAVFSEWLYRALIFLVVSCPCALVISIPLGFFGGIGGASRNGILIKGSNFLETLARVDTVVFDKTGTLTQGAFTVRAVEPELPFSREQLLTLAATAECHSSHPIARSILAAAAETGNLVQAGMPGLAPADQLEACASLPGLGMRVRADGHEILAGNTRLMAEQGIACPVRSEAGSRIHVARDGQYAGSILVTDTVKADAADAIRNLRAAGVRRIAMLTGDSEAAARAIAAPLGITDVHAGLLPQDKVAVFDALERGKTGRGCIVYVGDGINDAPVLARADIGIAMGGLGSDAAIEAADVVIMTDEPAKVAVAIATARRTRAVVWQNIVFALGIKLLVLILGATGHATMWEAVFADIGVTLIAVFNAMRLLRHR